MKTFINIIYIFLVSSLTLDAQNIPTTNVSPPFVTPEPLPADFNTNILGGKKNFVRSYEVLTPQTNASNINMASPVTDVKVSSSYYDGLGRPLQTVVKKAVYSNGYKDLVQTSVYDELGRESIQYLPYGSTTTNGKFDHNSFSNQNTFYNQQYFVGLGNYSNDLFRYKKIEYDNSPLNKVTATQEPGNAGVGSQKEKRVIENSNILNEVRIITINSNGLPVSTSYYNINELFSVETISEDFGKSVEFKDKTGKLILVKSKHDQGFYKTYNVYDDFGRLRFVIPPLAVEKLITTNWIFNQTLLNELCYQYKYDAKGRLTDKKIPGKEWEYYIYDARDRLVLSQDGNLRSQNANWWYFTFYDQQNRPKQTGIFYNGQHPVLLNSYVPSSRTNLIDAFDSKLQPGNGGLLLPILVQLQNQHHYLYLDEVGSHPWDVLDYKIYTFTFYDHYNHILFNPTNTALYAPINTNYNASKAADLPQNQPNAQYTSNSNHTMGLVTATATRVLDKPTGSSLEDWTTTTNFYDDNARLIQSIIKNQTGNEDYVSTLYDFRGKILATVEHHHNPDPNITSTQYNTTKILTKLQYDATENPTHVWSNINNMGDMPISFQSYDALKRVSMKYLGGNAESQIYTYNLRGMLTAINPDWVNNVAPSSKNFFGQTIHYDQGFSQPKYDGNISGIIWRGASQANGQRSYGYQYDYAGRLKHAEFRAREHNGNIWDGNNWQKNQLDFTVSNINYDANGNILHIERQGVDNIIGSIVQMDKLDYHYKTVNGVQSNQLVRVDESGITTGFTHGNLHDFKDGATTPTTGNDYDYDANGNLIKDDNKDIQEITYSYLNKPELISLTNGNTIQYVYDALGTKLQKIVNDLANNTITTTDYIGTHIYSSTQQNNVTTATLNYILHPEGRIRPALSGTNQEIYTYDFFVKDYLGNVRATINAKPTSGLLAYPPTALNYGAGFEQSNIVQEEEVFDDITGNVVVKPFGSSGNTQAIALDGDIPDKRIGSSILLRILPGDKLSLSTYAYYNSATLNDPIDPNEIIQTLASTLSSNYGGQSTLEGLSLGDVIDQSLNNPNFLPAYNTLLNTSTNSSQPKAYLEYLFFNDRMEFVPELSGHIQVNTANQWHELSTGITPMEFNRAGHIFVYLSVHDVSKVYYDDINLIHYQGELLEEDHYYPFGMTMNALHTQGTGLNNNYKYTGKEIQRNEFGNLQGLEWYDYGARMQDPQLGRWGAVDPLADKFPQYSPFTYTLNNPINLIDPDGKSSTEPPNLSKVTEVTDVLAGQKWIDYRNDIVTTNYFFGYEVSSSSRHGECADYSRLQAKQGNNEYTAVGSKKRVDMYVELGGDDSKLDLQKGVIIIIENLKEGRSVMAGVMYNPNKETGNANGATNHFVTIVGMGKESDGRTYFSYYDNFTGGKGEKVGRDTKNNRFYLHIDSKGNYYFADSNNNIPLNGNENVKLNNPENKPSRYILTEVRNNEK